MSPTPDDVSPQTPQEKTTPVPSGLIGVRTLLKTPGIILLILIAIVTILIATKNVWGTSSLSKIFPWQTLSTQADPCPTAVSGSLDEAGIVVRNGPYCEIAYQALFEGTESTVYNVVYELKHDIDVVNPLSVHMLDAGGKFYVLPAMYDSFLTGNGQLEYLREKYGHGFKAEAFRGKSPAYVGEKFLLTYGSREIVREDTSKCSPDLQAEREPYMALLGNSYSKQVGPHGCFCSVVHLKPPFAGKLSDCNGVYTGDFGYAEGVMPYQEAVTRVGWQHTYQKPDNVNGNWYGSVLVIDPIDPSNSCYDFSTNASKLGYSSTDGRPSHEFVSVSTVCKNTKPSTRIMHLGEYND